MTSSVSGSKIGVCRSTFLRSPGLLASTASQFFRLAGRYPQLPSFMRQRSAKTSSRPRNSVRNSATLAALSAGAVTSPIPEALDRQRTAPESLEAVSGAGAERPASASLSCSPSGRRRLFSASATSNAAWVSSSRLMSTTHRSLGVFRVEDGETFQNRNLTENLVRGHEGL